MVIGGASAIGWAVAQGLAAGGRQVTIADRNADGATERAADLGAPHDAARVDMADEASVAALFERTRPFDIVVNTAGIDGFGRITEQPVEDFRAIIDCGHPDPRQGLARRFQRPRVLSVGPAQ
ncbi:SDR family NAD(P)-dependent oxidoreductase [Mycolicibacterium sarraceniae]|uniref:Short-chain dehydrogenase n=1 Tax=Mycolicibacterium sarraceniae TaxID=1534348 RepID=A0A7I7SML5_9MYCO|nr:SDR family NAD(P)-dependent oxidoreductase [Mycolicibacterium sarraceniae]BBY57790.1 hypothetical protein MSAR_09260 [Mycolicibacterium sarraceniae]